MTNPSLPYDAANHALLLVEPGLLGQSKRATEIEASHYYVTKADNPKDIYLMKNVFNFSIAVLSDMIGFLALRASAQVVRGQWPKARILLLGKAPNQFEDHLYDESIAHASDGTALLAMLNRVIEDPWNQRSGGSAWGKRVSSAAGPQQSWPIQESDPRKMSEVAREAAL